MTTIAETQPEIPVGLVGFRDRKSRLFQKLSGGMKRGKVTPAHGRPPIRLGCAIAQLLRHSQNVARAHESSGSKMKQKGPVKWDGQMVRTSRYHRSVEP